METFVILQENVAKCLYCENLAFYYIHPSCKILGKRTSPYFIYTPEYGYIKAFDDNIMLPLVVEETALENFKFQIEICHKNGCHVGLTNDPLFIYYYTLTYKTKVEIVEKTNQYYQLKLGGWATKILKQIYPKPKKLVIFRFLTVKKPFWVIVTNNLGTEWRKNHETRNISFGSIIKIVKKGFVDNKKILYDENDGYIFHKDVSLLGSNFNTSVKNSNVCFICFQNSINCSYIHGDFAHSFCCFECSKKILSKTCPICRLPIEKIVINYIQNVPDIFPQISSVKHLE